MGIAITTRTHTQKLKRNTQVLAHTSILICVPWVFSIFFFSLISFCCAEPPLAPRGIVHDEAIPLSPPPPSRGRGRPRNRFIMNDPLKVEMLLDMFVKHNSTVDCKDDILRYPPARPGPHTYTSCSHNRTASMGLETPIFEKIPASEHQFSTRFYLYKSKQFVSITIYFNQKGFVCVQSLG